MANNIMPAKDGGRVWAKIIQRLERGSSMSTKVAQGSQSSVARIKRRLWQTPSTSADPAVDSGSQGTYPVATGDFIYRHDSDEVFICSVAPAATTDMTVIQCHG